MASATPSAGEQRRTKMALFYSNLRSSFLSRLKQQLGVENTTNAVENGGTLEHEKEATSVWLLSTALFSANGSHVSINNLNDTDTPTYTNLRFRYLHVQAYANAMNLNQLNLNYSPSSENGCDDKSSTPPITNNTFKPLDLIPNLIDSNQSNLVCVSKQHIHSWVAFNMCYKLAAPLVSALYLSMIKSLTYGFCQIKNLFFLRLCSPKVTTTLRTTWRIERSKRQQ